MKNTLTHTQRKALLHFAGATVRTVCTNHQINGERALIAKGLIDSRWEGMKNIRELTQAGKEVAHELICELNVAQARESRDWEAMK